MPSINYDADNHTMDRSFLTAKVSDLVAELTLDEIRELLTTQGWWHTTPVPRLQIPSIKVTDGPNGARGGSFYNMSAFGDDIAYPAPGVAFPSATCVAAAFDTNLTEKMGAVLAEETRARGAVCLLGPCVNIQRSPLGGRAFESPSEDPTVAGLFAAAYINGLEGSGVSSSLKHFVCNDQENDRNGSDSIVAARPLREVYMRPFQIALKRSAPSTIMASYNRLNGTHVSESHEILEGVLRKEWGFKDMLMSDWNGTYSCAEAINAGLDIEFPGPSRWRTKTLFDQSLEVNKITMRQINRNVARVLQWVQKLAKANANVVYGEDKAERTRTEARESDAKLLRKIAAEGAVLLKNDDNALPIRQGSVAVIGPLAKAQVYTGGGSARLLTAWGSTPYQGLEANAPDEVSLQYALGTSTARFMPMLDDNFTTDDGTIGFDIYHYPLTADGSMGQEWLVHDILTRSEVKYQDFGAPGLEEGYFAEMKTVFTSPITGEYDFGLCVTGKGWFWIDDKLVWSLTEYKKKGRSFYGSGTDEQCIRVQVEKGKKYKLRVVHDFRSPPNVEYVVPAAFRYGGFRLGAQQGYDPKQAMEEAAAVAAASDVAVVVAGLGPEWETEGVDRQDLSLPLATDQLIEAVAAANPNTVVVLQAGSAVAMPWINKVKSVVLAWYGGNETGNAIADVVYGNINPSGRLPITFPLRETDTSAALSRHSEAGRIHYTDDIYVGYRHYNARGITPLFPFGHGLSYTEFEYTSLRIDSVSSPGTGPESWALCASVDVTNAGSVAGSHSVHLYTLPPPRAPPFGRQHPSHTLQAFTKVHDLQPGETQRVTFTLDKYAVSHWDENENIWVTEPGTWAVAIGVDAGTLFGREEFTMGSDFEWTGL